MHLCGKKVSAISVNKPAKSCCSKAVKSMKCCKDKQVKVKITDKQQKSGTSKAPASSEILLFRLPGFADLFQSNITEQETSQGMRAPPTSHISACVINCVFRI
ncbi:HYC_CC_PP family protein [Hufsiella arboris]|uniref:HYC_CC_PP family protein n=1 Tax=Hufsiella arboris TaxID=2695275 RepID=UPI003F726EA4